jgi:hypothetical protein
MAAVKAVMAVGNKERPFFHQDDNPPPHRRDFPIDLQQHWSINRKIGDHMYYLIVRALTVVVLLFFLCAALGRNNMVNCHAFS